MWQTDILKWAVQLLPPVLRSKRLLAFVRVMIAPVKWLMSELVSYRETVNSRLDVTANVASLEHMLNQEFFLDDGVIRIEDGTEEALRYWHLQHEGQNAPYLYLAGDGGAYYLRTEDTNPVAESFVLYIPSLLATSTDAEEDDYHGEHLRRIVTLLNNYKPAGRTYRIEIYDYYE